jgi:hypothetical protein
MLLKTTLSPGFFISVLLSAASCLFIILRPQQIRNTCSLLRKAEKKAANHE